MPWKRNDAFTRKYAFIGSNRQQELHPNIFSEMGKKSRKYEKTIMKKIRKNFEFVFLPNEVCDGIAVNRNKIIFIEIKRNERHGRDFIEKQILFRKILTKITDHSYLVIKR